MKTNVSLSPDLSEDQCRSLRQPRRIQRTLPLPSLYASKGTGKELVLLLKLLKPAALESLVSQPESVCPKPCSHTLWVHFKLPSVQSGPEVTLESIKCPRQRIAIPAPPLFPRVSNKAAVKCVTPKTGNFHHQGKGL